MSDYRFSVADSQTARMTISSRSCSELRNQDPAWAPRMACEWSIQIYGSLIGYFSQLSYPYRQYWSIPFKDPLRSEIRRFFLSLDAYLESPNPVIPEKDILYGSAEYNFADKLKKIKRKSFEESWNVEHFAIPDWWKDIPSYRITDIGQIFNYSYLIFWKMEDPMDYVYGFEPISFSEMYLSKFRESVRELLPDRSSFDRIDDIEVLSVISSSMSIERGKEKHLPHYMIKDKHLYFADNIGVCERVVLQVSPNNCRDSILVDPAALNTISMIDKQLMEILRVMPDHIHLRDKDIVSRRLNKLAKRRFFLQRDLKKEGITKPRELLKIMLEVLHIEYPDIPIFGKSKFYDSFSIRKDGEVIFPKRGHGLGMANSLTTLMQLAIHNIVVDELTNDIPDIRADPLILNDDFVVALDDDYHLDQYWDKEDEVMAGLSLIRAPEKSFLSERKFVLAERYFDCEVESKKISFQLRECLLPLACANIVHAKEYFRSMQTYVDSKLAMTYAEEIKSYWGYEFFPSEFRYPYLVGGWRNERIDSIDLSLVELDELEFSEKVVRGFNASKVHLKKKKGGMMYQPPLLKLLGYPEIPEEFREIVDYAPISQINDKYGRILSKSINEFTHYWDKLKRERKKEFNKSSQISFEDLIMRIINHYDTVQFYPNKMMISHYEEVDIRQANVSDIYISPNPKLSMIARFNPISSLFRETFSIAFSNLDSFTKKTSSLYSKEVERSLKSEVVSVLFTGKFDEIYIPRGGNPEELYLNPIKIGCVASKIDWGKGYPIIFDRFRHPLLNRKKEVFNLLFTIDEQILLSDSGLSRDCIKIVADYLNNNHQESLSDVIDYLFDNHYIEKEITLDQETDEEESEEESDEDLENLPRDPSKEYVGVEDLILDESLIWRIHTNRSDFMWKDRFSERVIGDILSLLTVRNIAYGRLHIDTQDIEERLKSGYGLKVAYIVRKIGIFSSQSDESDGGSENDLTIDFDQLYNESEDE